MKAFFEKSRENCEEYLKKSGHDISAKLLGDCSGGISILHREDGVYYILIKLDEESEMAIMETSTNIGCMPEAASMISEYITKINSNYKSCNFRLETNGYIYVHVEQMFTTNPIMPDTFKKMELLTITMLETYRCVLQKIGSLRLLNSHEAEPEAVVEKEHRDIISCLIDDFEENKPILPPGFAEWESKIHGEKTKKEVKNDDADVPPDKFFSLLAGAGESSKKKEGMGKGLLEELLSISDNFSNIEIPDVELTDECD